MHKFALAASITVLSVAMLAQSPGQDAMSSTLKVGDMAPDFALPSTQSKDPVSLSSFRGKKNVVLAFFPAAFTGGCTKEMQTYQLGVAKFEGADTQVFGVSTDFTASQRAFAESLKLSFPLLSDFMDRKVAKEYGVLMPERGLAKRVTFVIDKTGKIAHMEANNDAIATAGALNACSRLSQSKSE